MEMPDQIMEAGRDLIAKSGFNGFSYADVAERVGVRKASIHHHFPSKSDLAVAVIRESRVRLEEHALRFAKAGTAPLEQIQGYVWYWKRCISDGTAPFCVAGMLASELTTLPRVLADEVQSHFEMLIGWFTELFRKGSERGDLHLDGNVRNEAEQFIATVYGAMLAARAMGNPSMFGLIVDAALAKLRVKN